MSATEVLEWRIFLDGGQGGLAQTGSDVGLTPDELDAALSRMFPGTS